MVVVKLRCTKCGHERVLTTTWLKNVGIKFSDSALGPLYNKINKLLPRFKCSECKAKGAKLIHNFIKNDNKNKIYNNYRENFLNKKAIHITKSNSPKSHSSTMGFPKGIPGYTANVSSLYHIPYREKSVTGWNKKTCHYCNGTGFNGNCFNCGGTGWEEATF